MPLILTKSAKKYGAVKDRVGNYVLPPRPEYLDLGKLGTMAKGEPGSAEHSANMASIAAEDARYLGTSTNTRGGTRRDRIKYKKNNVKTPLAATEYYTNTESKTDPTAGLGARSENEKLSGVDRTAGITPNPLQQYMNYFAPNSVLDRQKQVRDDFSQERQRQIDDIRSMYSSRIQAEQDAGEEDLARTRSMNLRAGLGGSSFGAAAKSKSQEKTRSLVRGVEAERDIAIAQTLRDIENLANQRIQLEEQALSRGLTDTAQFFEMQQKQKSEVKTRLADLGRGGLDINTIKEKDPQLYETLKSSSGMGDVEIETVMNLAKQESEQINYTFKTAGNKIFGYGLDPKTGNIKVIEQEANIPEGYDVTTMPNGTLLGIPKEWDGDTSKIVTIGNYAKPTAGTGSSGITAREVGDLSGLSLPAQNIIKLINTSGGTVDDYVKGTSNAAQSLRNEVINGLAQQGGVTGKSVEIFQEAKNIIDDMIAKKDYKKFGYSSILGGQFTTGFGDMVSRAQTVNAILARDNLGLLKGAMSDKDLAFLQSMSSGVPDNTISESFAKERMESIQERLDKKIKLYSPPREGVGGIQASPKGGDDTELMAYLRKITDAQNIDLDALLLEYTPEQIFNDLLEQ